MVLSLHFKDDNFLEILMLSVKDCFHITGELYHTIMKLRPIGILMMEK